MLWKGRRESDNVVDQRAMGTKSIGAGGLIIGAIVYYLMGGNPLVYLAQNIPAATQSQSYDEGQDGEGKKFVGVVLADTEDVWSKIFQENNSQYEEPKLVLFRNSINSACGSADSAAGPFYCPGDHQVYLDLSFFQELANSLGAKGEFAAAYVIAHEVGHHVQNLLGIAKHVTNQQRMTDDRGAKKLSVMMELQADCLAGVWAKQTQNSKNVIESGDIESALGAASAVGDDRLQQRAQGRVVPDSFTHGSSAQRVEAFQQGYGNGQLSVCLNTFRT